MELAHDGVVRPEAAGVVVEADQAGDVLDRPGRPRSPRLGVQGTAGHGQVEGDRAVGGPGPAPALTVGQAHGRVAAAPVGRAQGPPEIERPRQREAPGDRAEHSGIVGGCPSPTVSP